MIPIASLLLAIRDADLEPIDFQTLTVPLDRPVWAIKRAARQAADRGLINLRADGRITLTAAGLALIGARRPARR